jgi:hypothetical protein
MSRGRSEMTNVHTVKVADRRCVAAWAFRIANYESRVTSHKSRLLWRASPHCMVVNLVRSGRKQPQLFFASAGGRARLPLSCERSAPRALAANT